jgi:hypothetical protein
MTGELKKGYRAGWPNNTGRAACTELAFGPRAALIHSVTVHHQGATLTSSRLTGACKEE